MPDGRRAFTAAALAGLAACATGRPAPAPMEPSRIPDEPTIAAGGDLPPISAVRGPLRLDVVYPPEGAALTTRGSNFIFGSTGTGAATLRINGHDVNVAPNGAFLGFIPVPGDGVYRLEAAAAGEQATLTRRVSIPPLPAPVVLDTGSIEPRGPITVRTGERVAVRFRGAPGSRAVLLMPDGAAIPLHERVAVQRSEGFGQDREPAPAIVEYAGEFEARTPLRAPAGDAPQVAGVPPSAGTARIQVTRDGRVSEVPLPITLALLPADGARMAVVASPRPDSQLIASAVPGGGAPTAWPLPNGTRVAITGERVGAARLQLTRDLTVWTELGSVRLEPTEALPSAGSVASVRVLPAEDWVDVRLNTSDRLPFHVSADDDALVVEVYGARVRSNWLYYGSEDPLVRGVSWEQPRDDVYRLRLELARPAWGWRAWWDASGALMVRVRRAPRIDAARPLAGMHVAVDAGHPPGGATGPTGLTEAEANLAIARRLAALLRAAGATVTETRPDEAPVSVTARPLQAEQAGAHLFVSIHNNAFPDGVDPFANNGTSVFYNAPQSLGLARAMQRELLRELGLRDLGIALADLGVVRPTWMPSVLTETMFLMVPRQEAALRDPALQERIARAHLRAIESFLHEERRRTP